MRTSTNLHNSISNVRDQHNEGKGLVFRKLKLSGPTWSSSLPQESKYRLPVAGSTSGCDFWSSRFQKASIYPIHTSRARWQKTSHNLSSVFITYSISILLLVYHTLPTLHCLMSSHFEYLHVTLFNKSLTFSGCNLSSPLHLSYTKLCSLFYKRHQHCLVVPSLRHADEKQWTAEGNWRTPEDCRIFKRCLSLLTRGVYAHTFHGGNRNNVLAYLWNLWSKHTNPAKCAPRPHVPHHIQENLYIQILQDEICLKCSWC